MTRLVPLVLLMVVSCKRDEEPAGEKAPKPEDPYPALCQPADAWAPGTQAFEDKTQAWGLDGVEGVRLVAVDFTGDGWTDLVVHRGGAGTDDFARGGARVSWLLKITMFFGILALTLG